MSYLINLWEPKCFSQPYLVTGFHLLRIAIESKSKTTFRTPDGLYEWEVISFGLTNAPAYFMDLMSRMFRGQLGIFIVVIMDDILVFSKAKRSTRIT